MSSTSPVSPVQQRDIRSASKPFKRDRDADSKWANGTRPLGGVKVRYNPNSIPGQEEPIDPTQLEKVRPVKPLVYVPFPFSFPQVQEEKLIRENRSLYPKTHGNKTKPVSHAYDSNIATNRMVRKIDAVVESNDHTSSPLSKSLLELLPQHANNTNTAIQTTICEKDEGILYSFDSKSSPTGAVGLDALVEKAEKKWIAEQTDRIVKGEYEVLDAEGEKTVISGKKGKKSSPKQRAVKTMPAVVKDVGVEEDDGFELI
jgi:hypothetical protein